MKVIVAGGRFIIDMTLLEESVSKCGFDITEIVCGGAKGVDELGLIWGTRNDVPVKMFPADWDTHGLSAGPIRNRQMAEYADALILIWDGKSKGSKNMLSTMMKAGKPIYNVVI